MTPPQAEEWRGLFETLQALAVNLAGGAGAVREACFFEEAFFVDEPEAQRPVLGGVVDAQAIAVEAGFAGYGAKGEMSANSGSEAKGSGAFFPMTTRSIKTGRSCLL